MAASTALDSESTARNSVGREEQQERANHQAPEATIAVPTPDAPPSLQLPPHQEYSISTAFHADFLLDDQKPDVVLISSDRVLFYAHQSFLLATSNNTLNGLLSIQAIGTVIGSTAGSLSVLVPTGSTLFNVVLHTIYGISCKQFKPSLEVLLQAVKSLNTYGIAIDQVVGRNTPLFDHIVAETPKGPVDVFLVATEHNLDALAVAASAHLHSLVLPTITDEMAKRMGSTYLKRLMQLHLERTRFLRSLLLEVPTSHEDTTACGFTERKKLDEAWVLAATSVIWQIRPDFPTEMLRSTMGSLKNDLECDDCKKSLDARVASLVLGWSTNAKDTADTGSGQRQQQQRFTNPPSVLSGLPSLRMFSSTIPEPNSLSPTRAQDVRVAKTIKRYSWRWARYRSRYTSSSYLQLTLRATFALPGSGSYTGCPMADLVLTLATVVSCPISSPASLSLTNGSKQAHANGVRDFARGSAASPACFPLILQDEFAHRWAQCRDFTTLFDSIL
ncbi:hypothetical protein EIP91_010422 [Steccherinum ochraceum]|uniref:Uncharacterized protein n=1 Tax=Steccherinum ochraceum TaxID=92696 RepID=A0A4R0R9Q8_9APHY|nr:hypothetical protein EIP91_010422 [Steccherinum ochraceum]